MSEDHSKSEYEKLKNSKFKQHEVSGWYIQPSITTMTVLFSFIGIVFIAIGAVLIIFSNAIIEVTNQYDEKCLDQLNKVCNITLVVDSNMTAPIMVYYQLNNFYQNHRLYVKSKSPLQLSGHNVSKTELISSNDCDPVVTMKDLGRTKTYKESNTLLDEEVANPCGLIAKSFFNDTYLLFASNGTNIPINDTGIAWQADIEKRYKRIKHADSEYWKSVQWLDVEDEHFMVWMRTAGLPDFRKLWGRIQQDLPAGNYTMSIKNNYNVTGFEGEKIIILSTINGLGGKNHFLSISYFVVGGICLFLAILFCIGYRINLNKKENKED